MQNDTPLSAYDVYRNNPGPETLGPVLQELKPTIDYSLRSIGADKDPFMRSHAKVVVAESLGNYDPSKGSLATFASSTLRQLNRDYRKRKAVIPIPERLQLDRMHIQRSFEDLYDKKGEEPTMEELSDSTGIPIKRLNKVMDASIGIGTEGNASASDMPDGVKYETDWKTEALEYLYTESDRVDKKILEYKFGVHGAKPADNQFILQDLKLEPYQLSRRSLRLSKKLSEILSDLER